jgi:hypothetical protein
MVGVSSTAAAPGEGDYRRYLTSVSWCHAASPRDGLRAILQEIDKLFGGQPGVLDNFPQCADFDFPMIGDTDKPIQVISLHDDMAAFLPSHHKTVALQCFQALLTDTTGWSLWYDHPVETILGDRSPIFFKDLDVQLDGLSDIGNGFLKGLTLAVAAWEARAAGNKSAPLIRLDDHLPAQS